MAPVFFHVDLDAFFAAVEELDHPEYRGRPLVVGALPGERGVVATCNYEARKFRVRSAMPISQASRLCPHAVFVRPRFERYQEVSAAIFRILDGFSPVVRPLSIDEALLDMTGTEGLFGPPVQAAGRIKAEIRDKVGVTASIGIGPHPYLAKMASEVNKPDGLFEVPAGRVRDWLSEMDPIRLPGVGAKTRERLQQLGLHSVGQIQALSLDRLRRMLGESLGTALYHLANGQQPPSVETPFQRRSLGAETTFQEDVTAWLVIERTLTDLAHEVFFRALGEGTIGRTVVLKIRYHDFRLLTHRRALHHFVSHAGELADLAAGLFRSVWDGQPVRLVGVTLTELAPLAEEPEELFPDANARRRKVDLAVLRLQARFRGVPITKASLLGPREKGGDPSGEGGPAAGERGGR